MKIKLSQKQWQDIGKKAGWLKTARDYDTTTWQEEEAYMSRNICGYCERLNCDGTCTFGEELDSVISVALYYKKLSDMVEANESLGNETDRLRNMGIIEKDPMRIINTLDDMLVGHMTTLKRMEAKRPELKNIRVNKINEAGLAEFMAPYAKAT